MRWLELAGTVGAGKSALTPAAIAAVRAAGGTAMSAAELAAIRRGRAGPRRTAEGLAFGLHEPRLSMAVARALLTAPLTWRHRRAIAILMVRLAAASQASSRDGSDDYAVVDEGWVHRAVNLFAWTPGATDDAVAGYLASIPPPDVLVVVGAPLEARSERLRERGLPKRLRDKDSETIEAFLRRSEHILARAADRMEHDGVRVIRIVNDGPLDTAERALSTAVSDAVHDMPPAATLPPRVAIRPPILIPRPSLPRRRGRYPAEVDDAALPPVLAAYGLPEQRPRLLDDSGRSRSVIVDTLAGPAVLKRYKATLPTTSIRCQHAILRRLEELEFPSPRLLTTPDGDTLVERGGGRFDLTAYVAGAGRWDRSLLPPGGGQRLRRDAGATLASFHRLLEGFDPGYGHDARVAGNGIPAGLDEAIEASLRTGPPAASGARVTSLWDRGADIISRLRGLQEELEGTGLPIALIHGDYGPYNLLVRHRRPMHVMDLELSRPDWRAIELARAIPRFGASRRGFAPTRARGFLEGYLERVELTAAERRALPTLGTYLDLRRCAIAWGRYLDDGDPSWLDAAARHYRASDRGPREDDPLALLTDTGTGGMQ